MGSLVGLAWNGVTSSFGLLAHRAFLLEEAAVLKLGYAVTSETHRQFDWPEIVHLV